MTIPITEIIKGWTCFEFAGRYVDKIKAILSVMSQISEHDIGINPAHVAYHILSR